MKHFAIILALLVSMIPVAAPAQSAGPYAFKFTANGTQAFNISGNSVCTVEAASGSTMGSGTIALQTEGVGVAANVTGYPDLGVNTGGAQTLTAAGTKLSVPVGGATTLLLVLTGATSPVITGNIYCNNAAAFIVPTAGGGGSSNVALQTAGATPGPQVGTAGLTDGIWIGPSPNPTGSPIPNAIRVSTTAAAGGFATWGTSSCTNQGVAGTLFNISSAGGACLVTADSNGSLGLNDNLEIFANLGFQQAASQLAWTGASSDGNQCIITAHSGNGYLNIEHNGGSGTCTLLLPDVTGSADMCTGATGLLQPCSSNTTNYGEVTCTTVSSTTCSQTATVRSGVRCQATMETTDSTLAGPYYAPSVHTSSTTLTVKMTAFTSGSANLAANYRCA